MDNLQLSIARCLAEFDHRCVDTARDDIGESNAEADIGGPWQITQIAAPLGIEVRGVNALINTKAARCVETRRVDAKHRIKAAAVEIGKQSRRVAAGARWIIDVRDTVELSKGVSKARIQDRCWNSICSVDA